MDKDGGKLEQKVVLSNAERKTVENMSQELEEQRELASNRLAELEETNGLYKDALKEVETFITEERERMSQPEQDDEPDPPQKLDSKESDDFEK